MSPIANSKEDGMQTIRIRDNEIVLRLTKAEAKSLQVRLNQQTGVIASKAVERVRAQLSDEIDCANRY